MESLNARNVKIEFLRPLMRKSYDRIATTYNKGWRGYDFKSWTHGWENRVVYNRLVRRLPPGGRVLDLGCGVGVWLKQFHANGFRVAGIDQSPRMAAFTKRRVPAARVFCRNMVTPGFRDGSFDGILSLYAIIHVPQARQPGVFGHIHRLLRPGGHALFNVTGGATEYIGAHKGEWMYWSGTSVPESLRRVRRAGLTILWHEGLGPRDDHQHWILARKPA